MEQEATYLIAAGRAWNNEIEIEFGNETYTTIPISFRKDMPENSSEDLSLKKKVNGENLKWNRMN